VLGGSIDTTATAVAKIVAAAGRDRQLERHMREDAGELDRLYGWCNEALRRWPHNPILLRSATGRTTLGGRDIAAGDSVIAWTQAAMQDESAFPEHRRLRPDRDRSLYLHLGAGLHPCAGRAVNRFQIPLLIQGLIRRGLGRVGQIRWAGPFPNRLLVTLQEGPR